jgi:hypothetical protein
LAHADATYDVTPSLANASSAVLGAEKTPFLEQFAKTGSGQT